MSSEPSEEALARRRRRIARIVAVGFFPLLVALVAIGATASRWYDAASPDVRRGGISAASEAPAAPVAPATEAAPAAPATQAAPASVAALAPPSVAPVTIMVPVRVEAPQVEYDEFDFPAGFTSGAARPVPVTTEALRPFLAQVAGCGGRIEVLGHTDAQGEEQANLLLGMRRADYVRNLLIREGVDPGRLFTGSVGDREPPTDPSAAAPRLRRVTLRCERAPALVNP